MCKGLFFNLLLFFSVAVYGQERTVGVLHYELGAAAGYTLLAPLTDDKTYLLNNCGEVVYEWQGMGVPGDVCYLLEDGRLLRTEKVDSRFVAGGTGGRVLLQDIDGTILWSYNYTSDTYHHHHDVEYLPNGNILLIAWEQFSRAEAIEKGRNPDLVEAQGLWGEKVVELKPIGTNEVEVVWEWHLWDHLVQDFDSTKQGYGVIAEHPGRVNINYAAAVGSSPGNNKADWIHLNSVDYNAELDQILLSSRHLNEIWIIDHSTSSAEAASSSGGRSGKGGDLLYRWGNASTYDRAEVKDAQFFGQHDAQWLLNGEILVYNNGVGVVSRGYSTIDKIDPPMDEVGRYIIAENAPFAPAKTVLIYGNQTNQFFYSPNISGVQLLENGNYLICVGIRGNLIEIDPTGKVVWMYVNPVSGVGILEHGMGIARNQVFRAYKYAPDYTGVQSLSLRTGETIEQNPLTYACDISTSVEDVTSTSYFTIYPNPVQDYLYISSTTSIKKHGTVLVYDISGRLVMSYSITGEHTKMPISRLDAGRYLLNFSDGNVFPFVKY